MNAKNFTGHFQVMIECILLQFYLFYALKKRDTWDRPSLLPSLRPSLALVTPLPRTEVCRLLVCAVPGDTATQAVPNRLLPTIGALKQQHARHWGQPPQGRRSTRSASQPRAGEAFQKMPLSPTRKKICDKKLQPLLCPLTIHRKLAFYLWRINGFLSHLGGINMCQRPKCFSFPFSRPARNPVIHANEDAPRSRNTTKRKQNENPMN